MGSLLLYALCEGSLGLIRPSNGSSAYPRMPPGAKSEEKILREQLIGTPPCPEVHLHQCTRLDAPVRVSLALAPGKDSLQAPDRPLLNCYHLHAPCHCCPRYLRHAEAIESPEDIALPKPHRQRANSGTFGRRAASPPSQRIYNSVNLKL